ncbi:DUF1127 domain-containing protein [Azospirillum brasilense]|uniref:DUF1127 domain-containing protein n=2 Tax=Azospirillum brasilense TaxID=192 RepID=A0A6L3AZL1_AZOBR|nr:DUF1127 domain-containing protein [Azospirillum brasilense]
MICRTIITSAGASPDWPASRASNYSEQETTMSSTSIHAVLRADRNTVGFAAWRCVADVLLVRLGEGHRMRRTMASLQEIDDWTLKDIGVNRCEITCLAQQGLGGRR